MASEEMEQRYVTYLAERKRNWEWSTAVFPYMGRNIGLKGKRLLDLGCGFGWHAKMFNEHGAQVTGMDISADKLDLFQRETRGREGVQFVLGSAFDMPFEDGSFDIVFINQTIHHFIDPDKALVETQRVLADGGFILISDENRHNLVRIQHRFRHREGVDVEFKHHYWKNFYSFDEMQALLEKNGFRNIRFHCPGKRFNQMYDALPLKPLLLLYNIFITPNYFAYGVKSE